MAAMPKSPTDIALDEIAEINLAILSAANRLAQLEPNAAVRVFHLPVQEVAAVASLQTMMIHEYAQTPCSLLHIEGLGEAFRVDVLSTPPIPADPTETVEGHEAKQIVRRVYGLFDALVSSVHRNSSICPRFASKLYHLPIAAIETLAATTEMRLRAIRAHADLRFRLRLGAVRAIVDTFARESLLPPTRRAYSEIGVVARLSTISLTQRKR